MPKILRKTLVVFGNAGPTSSFGEFGSKKAGVPATSQDPAVIQSLAAWSQGWQDAVTTGNKAAYLEDMNGATFVHSYMTAYILQMGIPEWDSGTTYYLNSIVQDAAGNGQWFKSLQDNNTGNAPPVGASNAFWSWANAPFIPPPSTIAPGTIMDFAGTVLPAGYLNCDGSAVSRTTYAALFNALLPLLPWGVGDGATTFNLPNLNRRTTIGSGGAGTGVIGAAVGSIGGEETHTQLIAEMPAHTHPYTAPAAGGAHGGGTSSIYFGMSSTPGITNSTGGGTAFNIMQPSAVVIKMIKI